MRIAIVSDIHGNLTALEAVLADLRETAPDLIWHGGDLADGGARPVEAVDRIRELGWAGVMGNTDELLFEPASLEAVAGNASEQMRPMFAMIADRAAATSEILGEERLEWLRALPRTQMQDDVALAHATLESLWQAPAPEASDEELERAYTMLGRRVAVHGHIHQPYVRKLAGMTVANSGSVSLPYDGDCRAAYLLVDDGEPSVRRVEYDVEAEVRALIECGLAGGEWIGKMLRTGRFAMP